MIQPENPGARNGAPCDSDWRQQPERLCGAFWGVRERTIQTLAPVAVVAGHWPAPPHELVESGTQGR
jgi:hypothetical protein